MALPELIANAVSPSKVSPLGGGLNGGINESVTKIKVHEAAPSTLQGEGQFRISIDNEVMLVTGGAATTEWTVVRGVEGTTAESHNNNAVIEQPVTVGAFRELFGGLYAMDAHGTIGIGTTLAHATANSSNAVAIGQGALAALGEASAISHGQVGIGFEAGALGQGTEDGAVYIGWKAGRENVTGGIGNVGVGYRALELAIDGKHNVAVGDGAGKFLGGENNIAIGWLCFEEGHMTGKDNIGMGHEVSASVGTTGLEWPLTKSIFIGGETGQYVSDGEGNIVLGVGSVTGATQGKAITVQYTEIEAKAGSKVLKAKGAGTPFLWSDKGSTALLTEVQPSGEAKASEVFNIKATASYTPSLEIAGCKTNSGSKKITVPAGHHIEDQLYSQSGGATLTSLPAALTGSQKVSSIQSETEFNVTGSNATASEEFTLHVTVSRAVVFSEPIPANAVTGMTIEGAGIPVGAILENVPINEKTSNPVSTHGVHLNAAGAVTETKNSVTVTISGSVEVVQVLPETPEFPRTGWVGVKFPEIELNRPAEKTETIKFQMVRIGKRELNHCIIIGTALTAEEDNLLKIHAGSGGSEPLVSGNFSTRLLTFNATTTIGKGVVYKARHVVKDANYTAAATDYLVAYETLTAERTVTLPKPEASNAGQRWIIKDEAGKAATNNILVKPESGNIDNVASVSINVNYGQLSVYSNGTQYYVLGGPIGAEALTTGMFAAEAVTAPKLAAEAVETAKIKAEAVTPAKVAKPNFPAQPASEGEQKAPSTLGVLRTSWTAYNAKNETKLKKVVHGLGTENVAIVTAIVVSGGKEQQLPVKKWKVESATEIEVEFSETPSAKAEVWIFCAG